MANNYDDHGACGYWANLAGDWRRQTLTGGTGMWLYALFATLALFCIGLTGVVFYFWRKNPLGRM